LRILGLGGGPAGASSARLIHPAAGGVAQASGTFSLALNSGTPYLPFLGNQLVEVSWVPNATAIANVTAVYATALRRQSDCSLDEDFVLPTATTPSTAAIASVTGAQDYLHQLSGLTTKPDVFANGCDYQVLGLPATGNILLLGETADGAAISAQLASSGLYVTITDPAANTSKSTQLTSSQNGGGFFSGASLRNNGIFDIVETSLTDPATQKLATAVLLGNGDGTFKPAVYYDVSDNGLGEFTIDDVNGDGIPDIVELTTTSATIANVTTLIGKGDGTFTVGPVSAVTGVPNDQPVTGDFNGDGNKDVLVGGTVLFGAGNGSFTVGPTNTAIASATNYLFAPAVGALSTNGKLDVVVSEPGFVSIYYGNGDGTFTTGPSYAALPDYMQLTITDIDGDGNPDILLGTSTGGIYTSGGYDTPLPMFQILMGRGDGTFVDSPVYNQGTYGVPGNPSNGGLEIASADFNGDGKPDVLAFNRNSNGGSSSSLLMMPGDGKGNLGTPVTSSVNIGPVMVVAAKMYHDAMPDAVLVGQGSSTFNPQVSVLINQGNGTFAGEQDYALAGAPVSLAVGDFNGDGLMDVAVGESGMGVFVLLGQANGTLGTPVQIDSSKNPTGLAAGSLTTDGRTDLVVADQGSFSYVGSGQQVNGALHVYLGNANGTFTTVTAPTTAATNYTVAALGDLNNDGKLDLIVAGNVAGASAGASTPNVYTLLGNGDGTFQAANTLALSGQDGIGASSIALADFNKDGKLDVTVGNPNDLTEVLLGNGDGTLVDSIPALGQRPATVAAADLLGNGYPELLVGESTTLGQWGLAVFLNSATGWTAAATTTTPTVTVTPSPSSITTAQSTMVTVTVSGAGGAATPTGSVTLTSGTYASAATTLASGSATITVPVGALATGTDTLTATYTPDSASSALYIGATGTNSVTVSSATAPGFALSNGGNIAVAAAATTGNMSTITVTPTNGFTGTVNLTCAVTTALTGGTSPATCAVTPSVSITGATAQTATVTVTTTSTTTVGAYAVTVTGTSGAVMETTTVDVTVTAPTLATFALTNSGGITLSPGATTGNTSTISVTEAGGFTGAVTLSCAISPMATSDPATCSLSPGSVTISGTTAQTSTLTVDTTAATSAALSHPQPGGIPWYAASGTTLACVLLFGIPVRRRGWRAMLGMIVLLAFLTGSIVSCGGSSGGGGTSNSGTTAGAYTVTVSGTSGSTMETTTVAVTVN
jgi:hypothetical protein